MAVHWYHLLIALLLTGIVLLWRKNRRMRSQLRTSLSESKALQARVDLLEARLSGDADSALEKIVHWLVGLGVPGVVLLIAMSTSGVAGAAALTGALAALGGPLGMLGGIAVLGMLVPLSRALSRYGLPKLLQLTIQGLKGRGLSEGEIITTIESYPVPERVKREARKLLSA